MPCVNRAVDVGVRLEIFGSESFSVWELYSVALGLGFLCVCVCVRVCMVFWVFCVCQVCFVVGLACSFVLCVCCVLCLWF